MQEVYDNFDHALKKTKTALTSFFDFIDKIDRNLYGKKMQYFAWGVATVLIISPLLDWLLEIPYDRLTYLTTMLFFFFVLTVTLAWISAWRDDSGNWTLKRATSRIKTYIRSFRDTALETKTSSSNELLFKTGKYLVYFALAWKAFQNLSVFARKPLEWLTDHPRIGMRNFERTTNKYYWIFLLVGTGIIIFLYYKDKQIWTRIKNDLKQLFGSKSELGDKYHNEIAKIETDEHIDLVINTQQKDHVEVIITKNRSLLFNDFVTALEKWKPGNCHYEYEFQDNLFHHLRKHLKGTSIELEKPIGDSSMGNKGRADIVINDTILIEMKRDSSAGAVQRAQGQIAQYSRIWKDKGPVILLLCNYEYDHAKLNYAPTMQELVKLERSALTIVAN